MRILSSLLVLLLVGVPAGLTADIYRCPGEQGEILYSGRPCGVDAIVVLDQPVAVPGAAAGLRPSEVRWLKARERERAGRRGQEKPRAEATKRRATADQQAYRCQRKQHQLDAVRSKLRRGYKPAQGERLRHRRRALEDYLSAFCG